MPLPTVAELFPGRRAPAGADTAGLLRADAAITLQENLAFELGNAANARAQNAGKEDETHRQHIAGFMRPFFDTRAVSLVYGEAPALCTWQPYDKLGWILAGVTIYPPMATDFTFTTGAVQIHGLDEITDLFLPVQAIPYHVSMRAKIYGTINLTLQLLGTAGGKTVQAPAVVQFQMESWGEGVPLPSGE